MSDVAQSPAESPFHARLPIGERLDASALSEGLPWAFEEIRMRPLDPMLVPEKPRGGEVDPSACRPCEPSKNTIWHDDLWQVYASPEPSGLPFIGALSPREHWLLEDAPVEVLAALGPLMQPVSCLTWSSTAGKAGPGFASTGSWSCGARCSTSQEVVRVPEQFIPRPRASRLCA